MVMMTAGNLSISQSVRQLVSDHVGADGLTIWNAPSMYAARASSAPRCARCTSATPRRSGGSASTSTSASSSAARSRASAAACSIYAAGNFIESHDENTYFQIGEAKYGKPILDRVVTPGHQLDEAAKCALISMDSTLRSNISVGLPLDLLVYEDGPPGRHPLRHDRRKEPVLPDDPQQLGPAARTVFEGIDDPVWDAAPEATANVLSSANLHSRPVRVALPEGMNQGSRDAPLQSLAAQDFERRQP
jgi:putative proteasome-type protease